MTDVSIEDGENISELLVFWPTTDSKKGCPYCAESEVVEDNAPVQDRPAPVQRGLF